MNTALTSIKALAALALLAGCLNAKAAIAEESDSATTTTVSVSSSEEPEAKDSDEKSEASSKKKERAPKKFFNGEGTQVSFRQAIAAEPVEESTSDETDSPSKGPFADDTPEDVTPGAATTVCDTCGQSDPCGRCCKCGPPGRFWFRDEYLGFWAKGGHAPALVNTSPDGTLPTTNTLYGNSTYNGGFRSGNWTQGGMWLDCRRQWGVQGDYFFLGRQSSPFFASSNGDPILTRPFTDANTGLPADQLIAFPGVVVGNVTVSNYNSFAGAGGALKRNLCCWEDCCDTSCQQGCGKCFQGQNCSRLDFLAGFRYFRFNDNLGVREQLTSIDPTSGVAVGTQFDVQDSFRTVNNFYGVEFGLVSQRYRGRWLLEGAAKVALGTTQQTVAINGNTTISFPGQPTAFNQGGLLALGSNIGNYSHNKFTAIPQFSGRLGYRVTQRFTFLVGYTFLYWNHVARAADQIDTTVNPNLIPPPIPGGPNRPAFSLHNSDIWLQGVTIGGELYF